MSEPIASGFLLVACLAWCGLSDQGPRPDAPEGKPALASRPLHIEDADPSIVKATISGPEFGASSLFLGVEDPLHPLVTEDTSLGCVVHPVRLSSRQRRILQRLNFPTPAQTLSRRLPHYPRK